MDVVFTAKLEDNKLFLWIKVTTKRFFGGVDIGAMTFKIYFGKKFVY